MRPNGKNVQLRLLAGSCASCSGSVAMSQSMGIVCLPPGDALLTDVVATSPVSDDRVQAVPINPQQDVLGLQVAVDLVLAVRVLEAIRQLIQDQQPHLSPWIITRWCAPVSPPGSKNRVSQE